MINKISISVVWLLVIFTIYCGIVVGLSYDTFFHADIGNKRLKYLFSLGKAEYTTTHWHYKFYPGLFDTISAFVTKMFPKKYEIEVQNIVRCIFSISTIFGISKISKELFNAKVGKIVFILCFFNPIFFGHMAINPKDTIIAFSNVWSTYLILKYLKNQTLDDKRNHYVILLGLTIGLGMGTKLVFPATLLPVLLFVFIDIFFIKKVVSQNFSNRKFTIDIIKVLFIAYFLMISCWVEVHENIFVYPIKYFLESFSDIYNFGLSSSLLNGNFYLTAETPKIYLLINLFYKTPEFVLFSYFIFIILYLNKKNYFTKNFTSFNTKLLLILSVIIFPNILLLITPYKIIDGLRYFLYLLPYISIIPALAIYYLINNYKDFVSKIATTVVFSFLVYHLFIFFLLTPYQYTYLNIFNGNFSNAHTKYENDYWSVSIKELIDQIPKKEYLLNNKQLKIAYCGVASSNTEFYLKRIKNFKFNHSDSSKKDYDYIIMTNRVIYPDNIQKNTNKEIINSLETCYSKFVGKDVLTVKRNGLLLSTLRKIN